MQWTPGDYDKKVAAGLLTSSGPDIFEAGNGPSIDQIQSGQVVPLDGVLGDAASDFNPSLIKRMTYQGKLYGVPQVIDTQLLVYRKSMWLAVKLEPMGVVGKIPCTSSWSGSGLVDWLALPVAAAA